MDSIGLLLHCFIDRPIYSIFQQQQHNTKKWRRIFLLELNKKQKWIECIHLLQKHTTNASKKEQKTKFFKYFFFEIHIVSWAYCACGIGARPVCQLNVRLITINKYDKNAHWNRKNVVLHSFRGVFCLCCYMWIIEIKTKEKWDCVNLNMQIYVECEILMRCRVLNNKVLGNRIWSKSVSVMLIINLEYKLKLKWIFPFVRFLLLRCTVQIVSHYHAVSNTSEYTLRKFYHTM